MKKCDELMTKDPVYCLPNDAVARAAQLMKKENVGPIPSKVVADGRDPKVTKVEEVMTREVVTCRAEDELQKALDAMSEHQLPHSCR